MTKKAIDNCYNIAELAKAARKRLPGIVWDALEGGAEDEVTLRSNTRAFENYEIAPRFLRDVKTVNTTTTIGGVDLPSPIILAPTGYSRLWHPEGEMAAARGAKAFGTVYSLSSVSNTSIEDVGSVDGLNKWFQIYVWRDRGLLREFIQRCRESGYKALCLTVDVPGLAKRERDIANGMTLPPSPSLSGILDILMHPRWLVDFKLKTRFSLANVEHHKEHLSKGESLQEYVGKQFDPSVTWKDLEWMLGEWNDAFYVKGLLHPDDAKLAVDTGATGVVVSNHGGRQLDHAAASIDALPAIADALNGRGEIILDSGIRRGTDIVKALCLGANAVMIGRPYLYGLSAFGQAGVEKALEILADELAATMRLMGCVDINELGRHYLHPSSF